MSLTGARGLVRIATNLDCGIQASMVADRQDETRLFRALTGRDYPREYGERISARRRGAKFEANLYLNNAALLRQAVGILYGHDPQQMWVRNLLDELPGEKIERLAMRSSRFRQVMRDLANGRPVPDLIIQPAMPLRTGPGPNDIVFISPDYVVLDRGQMIYIPGELKSFIVRDVGPDPGDLAPTRLQAAAQVIALRQEAARVGLDGRVSARAVFVFATPRGLIPTDGVEERLDAELYLISKAMDRLGRAKLELARLRVRDQAGLADLVSELRPNFQETCIANCALADVCRAQYAGRTAELGDDAVAVFGPDVDVARLAQLAAGATPTTPSETDIAVALREAAQALGFGIIGRPRRTA